MDVRLLQNHIEAKVTTSFDAGYEHLRRAMVWNQFTPPRQPRMIVQVTTESDVVETIGFARANGIKIAVRGGGHSWVGFPLRDESLLIDLGRLNHAAIDPQARMAVIGPTVTGRELDRQLSAHGLAFPVGHCPTVPLSGFLLNGGLGWNFNAWGPACFSIEAATVITADGNVVVANQGQNADLLWAVRGGGPGFFGVVTKYSLRVYPVPRAITTTNYYFSLQRAENVGAWVASIADKLPKHVELAILFAPAPPALAERCRPGNGFVCIVSATAFVDTVNEAVAALGAVNDCPVADERLEEEVNLSTPLGVLLDMGGTLLPERHRYLADTLWTNSSPATVLGTLRDHFMRAPSSKSLAVFVRTTGADQGVSPLPDGAYSMTASALLLCYAIWERPEDDAANAAWHREAISALDKFAVGHYVGESDIVTDPQRAEKSYAKANWQRLQSLRWKYDREGLFHGHFATR